MRARIATIAALATILISGAALAEGVKGAATTTTGPVVMTDAELDAVTAGVPALTVHGVGNTPGGLLPPNGNVALGGANLQGVPNPPGIVSGNPHAFGGHASQAAKPCAGC